MSSDLTASLNKIASNIDMDKEGTVGDVFDIRLSFSSSQVVYSGPETEDMQNEAKRLFNEFKKQILEIGVRELPEDWRLRLEGGGLWLDR